MTTAVAIVSGGMDSVTLAHLLAAEHDRLVMVSVHYGQRHERELTMAALCATRLGAVHHVVNLSSLGKLLTGSALTDPSVPVPEGHYAAPTMAATVVPNRNALLLDLGVAVAVVEGAQVVAIGVHAGDHAIYPDCRPEFIEAYNRSARLATEGFAVEGFHVVAPFIHVGKDRIATLGESLGVPWGETWSCYQGEAFHCGRCGTCVERKEAFALAGVDDVTHYQRYPNTVA